MSVGPTSTNPKSFLSDDAAWMKTRQAEWRLVLHRVRASEFELNREQLRKLKSYFFTGSPCPLEHDYLPTYPLSKLAVWWFNPEEPDPKFFEFPVNSRTDLDSSRGALLSTYFALVREAKKEGAGGDEYGGMGGRELPMMRALNPGVDRKKPHKLGGVLQW